MFRQKFINNWYHPLTLVLSPKRLCRNSSLSLRATEGSVAISLFSMHYEIASVVSLPRNDIATQPQRERGVVKISEDDSIY